MSERSPTGTGRYGRQGFQCQEPGEPERGKSRADPYRQPGGPLLARDQTTRGNEYRARHPSSSAGPRPLPPEDAGLAAAMTGLRFEAAPRGPARLPSPQGDAHRLPCALRPDRQAVEGALSVRAAAKHAAQEARTRPANYSPSPVHPSRFPRCDRMRRHGRQTTPPERVFVDPGPRHGPRLERVQTGVGAEGTTL
jgi:hypothetical protein